MGLHVLYPSGRWMRIMPRFCDRDRPMKRYKVYGLGAALVDTELRVTDSELAELGVEKGLAQL